MYYLCNTNKGEGHRTEEEQTKTNRTMKSDKSIRRIAREARENGTKYIISSERRGMYWHLYEVCNNDAEMPGLAWLHTFDDYVPMGQREQAQRNRICRPILIPRGMATRIYNQIVRAIHTGMDMQSRDTQVRHYRQVVIVNVDGRRVALKEANGTIWLFTYAKEQRRVVNRMQAVLDAFDARRTVCIRDGAVYLDGLNKRVHIAVR